MSKSITIEYHTDSDGSLQQSYQLTVRATNAVEMPAEIFMWRRAASAPTGQEPVDTFECVADPVDLDEVPARLPDLANEQPYYRTAEVTLAFRSVADLEMTRLDIGSDIVGLVRALNQRPALMETVTYD